MSAKRRVTLTPAETAAVKAGHFVRVDLVRSTNVGGFRVRSAFVGRAEGRLVAWANLCQHNPVPLDATGLVALGPPHHGVRGAPMSDDGKTLVCHSHGALFRPNDGMCVLGPCYGQALFSVAVEENGDEISLVVDD